MLLVHPKAFTALNDLERAMLVGSVRGFAVRKDDFYVASRDGCAVPNASRLRAPASSSPATLRILGHDARLLCLSFWYLVRTPAFFAVLAGCCCFGFALYFAAELAEGFSVRIH